MPQSAKGIQKKPSRDRKGRGSKGLGTDSVGRKELLDVSKIFFIASSGSTKSNVRMASSLLSAYTKLHNAPDPEKVTEKSSKLIVNLLSEYCRVDSEDPLSISSMRAICQGLCHVYRNAGHETAWSVDAKGLASGNPLIGNSHIEQLHKTLRIRLAQVGSTPKKARPLTASQICHHAEKYWYGNRISNLIDARDILLHAILVLSINMGVRFDEIVKMNVTQVSVDCGDITLNITESIKNSTVQRTYKVRDWPRNTALYHSVYMDPKLALLTWMTTRRSKPGPLFCDAKITRAGVVLDPTRAWQVSSFTNFFRSRLQSLGVGQDDTGMYTGHSLKRGSVQLYRSLGYEDEYIMDII